MSFSKAAAAAAACFAFSVSFAHAQAPGVPRPASPRPVAAQPTPAPVQPTGAPQSQASPTVRAGVAAPQISLPTPAGTAQRWGVEPAFLGEFTYWSRFPADVNGQAVEDEGYAFEIAGFRRPLISVTNPGLSPAAIAVSCTNEAGEVVWQGDGVAAGRRFTSFSPTLPSLERKFRLPHFPDQALVYCVVTADKPVFVTALSKEEATRDGIRRLDQVSSLQTFPLDPR